MGTCSTAAHPGLAPQALLELLKLANPKLFLRTHLTFPSEALIRVVAYAVPSLLSAS